MIAASHHPPHNYSAINFIRILSYQLPIIKMKNFEIIMLNQSQRLGYTGLTKRLVACQYLFCTQHGLHYSQKFHFSPVVRIKMYENYLNNLNPDFCLLGLHFSTLKTCLKQNFSLRKDTRSDESAMSCSFNEAQNLLNVSPKSSYESVLLRASASEGIILFLPLLEWLT